MRALVFVALVGCGPAFTTGAPSAADALARDAGAVTSDDAADALPSPLEAAAVPVVSDASTALPDVVALPPVDAAVTEEAASPTCGPIGGHLECGDNIYTLNGSTFDNQSTSMNRCEAFATPPACQCVETYTCECILFHSTSCISLFGTGYLSCTMQSNGVPLVSCQ